MTETTCKHCGDTFSARDNWLTEHETCPACFDFPDQGRDEYDDRDYDVYMVARVQVPSKSLPEEGYYRVAARSEHEACWFVEAFVELEYSIEMEDLDETAAKRHWLSTLTVDENGQANTRMKPVLTAAPVPEWARHDGYAVRHLDYRDAGTDHQEQSIHGDRSIDTFNDMSASDYQDVIIHATEEQIDHKLAENIPDGHRCYWDVNGRPRKTRHGQRIFFENDGRIVAAGHIIGVEAGRMWFTGLKRVDAAVPTDVPSRGYKYIDDDAVPEVLSDD